MQNLDGVVAIRVAGSFATMRMEQKDDAAVCRGGLLTVLYPEDFRLSDRIFFRQRQ